MICLRQGETYSLVDAELKTNWLVHSFAFMLNPDSDANIVIDREHTEYRFIGPEELGKFDIVANLEIGMKAALIGTIGGAISTVRF